MNRVLRHLRRQLVPGDNRSLSDGHLLERFITHREEEAFAALVHRHGPMVMGVCLRVLRHWHDAEDAFQATFLVLARKAASVQPRSQVGNWLHGVAQHTALKARAGNSKREQRQRLAADVPEPPAPAADGGEDWRPVLDKELRRLPERYRAPVVLCDLEGSTRKEAAQRLGWPEGTLSSRLARGRHLLARRLAQRGLLPAGAALVLAPGAALASVPATVQVATVKAACLYAAGRAAGEVASAKVAALTEGVHKSMFVHTLRMRAALVLALVALVAVVIGGILQARAAAPAQGQGPKQPDQPVVDAGPAQLPQRKPPAQKLQPATLNWNLQPGHDFGLEIETDTRQAMKVQGGPVAQRQKQTFFVRYFPQGRKGKHWVVVQRIDRVVATVDIGGNKFSLDTDRDVVPDGPLEKVYTALVGTKLQLVLDNDYKVVQVRGVPQMERKILAAYPGTETVIKQIVNEATFQGLNSFFQAVPRRAVCPGDRWRDERTINLGNLASTQVNHYVYTGPAGTLHLIKSEPTFTFRPPDPKAANVFPFQVKKVNLTTSEAAGTFLFDGDRGRLHSARQEVKLAGTLTVNVGGQATEIALEQAQTTIIRALAK
jgi:RNA polymerase sigma factor (sigma-70 family)